MQSKLIIIIGLIIISAVITSWIFFINYETEKIPLDYKLILEQEGEDQILKSVDGVLSEPFSIKGLVTQRVENVEQNFLKIHSVVLDKDISTGEIVFESSQMFLVDANTRKHYEDDIYFLFPSNVKKQNYEVLHPIVAFPTTFVYEETRIVDGLEVYVFSCAVFEQDISDFFTNFPQKKIFYDGKCMALIEPVTGLEVDFELKWDNYIIENGVRGQQVELGYKKNTPDTVAILIQTAKNLKELYNIYKIILPLVISFIGAAILLILVLLNENKIKTKHIINARNEIIKKEKLSTIGQLSASLTHDLRNPLSLIINSIQIIDLSKNNLDEKSSKCLDIIKSASNIMSHQINDVLDFVRVSPPKFEKNSFLELVNRAIDAVPVQENVNIIKPEKDFEFSCDFRQMEVVLINLLTNAVQAVNKKGEVKIMGSSNDKNTVIEIQDSGSGIPKDDLPKIFEPLFTTRQGGTGLGLISCKNIVESHGGILTLRQNPTIFVITIPKKQ